MFDVLASNDHEDLDLDRHDSGGDTDPVDTGINTNDNQDGDSVSDAELTAREDNVKVSVALFVQSEVTHIEGPGKQAAQVEESATPRSFTVEDRNQVEGCDAKAVCLVVSHNHMMVTFFILVIPPHCQLQLDFETTGENAQKPSRVFH
jgi:hypothetical protein